MLYCKKHRKTKLIQLTRKSSPYCPKCSAKVPVEKERRFTVGDIDFSELTDDDK